MNPTKGYQKAILAGLLGLLIFALAAYISTRDWVNSPTWQQSSLPAAKHSSDLIDTRSAETAQELTALAVTPEEQDHAKEALRLADLLVDVAFSAALRDATESPAPLTPETRELSARVKEAETRLAADEDRVAQLTQQVAKARASAKDALQQDLDLAQEQLSLDKDWLNDAHQDLIRAGGDKHATVQQLLDKYKASRLYAGNAGTGSAASNSVELTRSSSLVAQARAWNSLHNKERVLRQAQQSALSRAAEFTTRHEALTKELNEEKSQKKILHNKTAGSTPERNTEAANVASETTSALSLLRHLTHDQKELSELGESIDDEQELAAVYANWIALVTAREHALLHGSLQSAIWIFLIAVLVFAANYWIQRFFADLTPERRQLHTLRAFILFFIQALGIVLILLVIFGAPNNFATVVALAGAGLTVALKDFIVGFFGWFVLVGKNGIRPGDWVEINDVGGEVLEVGLLHTVLLETGNWSDAGHPTGRKVTFVNSFAIEGHYFNFSTSGQWLWDEIQMALPENADPFLIAEAIQKIVADETAANAGLAEQEWERATPGHARRSFSAAPSMSVRPTDSGVNVLVRYLTRVNERHEVRARLYRALVELLHKKDIPQPAFTNPSSPSVADRAQRGDGNF
ncbi:MAG: mechanosensitive ion channel domain-containing protein [Candidatus Acidiferrales bacterium]